MAPSARHQRSEKRTEEDTRNHRHHHHRGSRRRSRSLQRRDSPKRDHPSHRRQSPIRNTRRSPSPQSRRVAESNRPPVNRRTSPSRGSAAFRTRSPSPRRNQIPRSRSPENHTRVPRGGAEGGNLRSESRNLSPRRGPPQDHTSIPSARNPPIQSSSARLSESGPQQSGEKRKARDRPADLLPDKRRRFEDNIRDRRRQEFSPRNQEHHRASSPRSYSGRRGDRLSDRRHRARSPRRGPRPRSPPPPRRRSPPGNRAPRLNSPSQPGSSRRPLSPGPRESRQSSRSRHLDDARRSRSPEMYPQSGGNYYPAQHGRNYPPPIDTRYAQQSPHGAGPSPQHGYGPRGEHQGSGYGMSNSWSPTHAPQGYPTKNSELGGYGSQGGPSPSNHHSQASPYSRPLPSPRSARGHHAFSPQGSPPGPQSHASSPHHTGNPSRRGSLSSRGGFAPQSRKGSESSSTPASSRGGASVRGGAHFSNLTWKPNVGVRGGQAPTSLFQTQQKKKEEEEAEAKKAGTSEKKLAGPTDPNDPENPFRVPDNAAAPPDERAPRADPDDPENPFRVPDDSRRSERGGDRPSNGKSTSSEAMQQPPDGPKISFNMKKPASGSAPLAPKRDLLNQAKAQAAAAENSRQPPPTDPKRDREQDRRSLYSIRDNRDNRDNRDDRGWDRRDNRDRDDYRGGPGRDRHRDRGRDRFNDHDRDRGRNGMSRSERELQDRPAKPAKPKAPPVSLPDLNSMGRTARYAPAPPTIPVSVTADTPVWLVRQLLDGARQNHRRKARLPPADWLKSNPPKLSLPEEQKTAKSQYPKQEDSVVGAGTYGQVYKTVNVYKPNQGAVALKRVAMASESQNNGFPFTSVRELGAIVSIKDLRIPKYIESMVERVTQQQQGAPEKVDLWYYMVFEYVPYDLAGIINHPTVKLELAHRKDLAKQMYDGLVWLHSVGILHRDIKAGNILVDHSCTLKITDFGLAKRYDLTTGPKAKHTNRIVTIWYRCPELLLGDNYYGTEPDFWAAACVLGEILLENGQALFPGPGTDVMQLDYMWTILGKPTKQEWPSMTKKPWYNLLLLDDQYRRKIHDSGGSAKRYVRKFEDRYTEKFTPAAMDLLQSCLQWDPAKRPDGHQVLAHRFFTEEEPAPQRFTGLGDALGGDFHEFDYKKHRDAARAQQREQQKAERDQRKRDEAAAREKLKRGAEAGDMDGVIGQALVNKKPKRASIEELGVLGSSTTVAAADGIDAASKTVDEDLSMEVEVSMEPGAPIDPSDGPVAGVDAGVNAGMDGGNDADVRDAGEMDVDVDEDIIKPSA